MRAFVVAVGVLLCCTPTPALPAIASFCYRLPTMHSRRCNGIATTILNALDKSRDSCNPEDPLSILPHLYTYRKPRQKRQPQTTLTRPRKPRFYWHSEENMLKELNSFWEELDVPIHKINPGQPPPIPSEYLLNLLKRNDLRWGIAQMGGRENVSHLLGGAKVLPGRWNQAKEFEEVKCLLPRLEDYTKKNSKKAGRKQVKSQTTDDTITQLKQKITTITTQQSHGDQQQLETIGDSPNNMKLMSLVESETPSNSTKKVKEFWSKEKAIKELYQYLHSYRKYKKRPAVWMPQIAELRVEGYSKLFISCRRFKNLPCISTFIVSQDTEMAPVAGLVSFREWRFFESQLQLFVELKHYLNLHHNGSEEYFPEPDVVKKQGHQRLVDLIRIHGGKTLLAEKLDMKAALFLCSSRQPPINSWGTFSVDFAVQLMHLIRSQYISLSPPLSPAHISMPTEKDLRSCGQHTLADQVIKYGGEESVARRLGLAYFDGKSSMDERKYRGAKLLWKERNSNGVLTGASARFRNENVVGRKAKGVPWDENLVINELHAYTKANNIKSSLPDVVMPWLPNLERDGRADLRQAIYKCGGKRKIAKAAGLIPFETWEEFSYVLMELSRRASTPSHAKERSPLKFQQLQIQISKELGCMNQSQLQACVDVLSFIQSNFMASEPPLSHPTISMPSEDELHRYLDARDSSCGFDMVEAKLSAVFESFA